MDVIFRLANLNDIPKIIELCNLVFEEDTEIEFNRAEEQIMTAIELGKYSTEVKGISNPDRLKAFLEPLGYHIEMCGECLMVSWFGKLT